MIHLWLSLKDSSFEGFSCLDLRSFSIHFELTGLPFDSVHYYAHGRITDIVVDSPFILGHESAGLIKGV